MSIRIVSYPTRLSRPKKSLSSISWSEISAISISGDAPYLFTLGDRKDGATLVNTSPSGCVFSLGDCGSACIQRANSYSSDHLGNTYLTVKDTGWYLNTSYASGAGITLNSVWSSLPQDLRSVIKTVTKSFKRATDEYQSSSSGSFTLYPPTYSEWMTYADYLPKGPRQNGVFWLRDAIGFIKDVQTSSKYYKEGSWFETYNVNDNYHGEAGYGWTGTSGSTKEGITNEHLVLLFEV